LNRENNTHIFWLIPLYRKKKMSFSEQIEEDDELLHVYEKMIFNTFHKRIKQLKQVNNKRYVY